MQTPFLDFPVRGLCLELENLIVLMMLTLAHPLHNGNLLDRILRILPSLPMFRVLLLPPMGRSLPIRARCRCPRGKRRAVGGGRAVGQGGEEGFCLRIREEGLGFFGKLGGSGDVALGLLLARNVKRPAAQHVSDGDLGARGLFVTAGPLLCLTPSALRVDFVRGKPQNSASDFLVAYVRARSSLDLRDV
jgi:hypothetical protein